MIKIPMLNFKRKIIIVGVCVSLFSYYPAPAQDNDLELNLDAASNTVTLPKIFRPNIDLSGRGFSEENSWPQELAAPEALDSWEKDIGFSGIYRLQYNLWEIIQLSKDKPAQNKLLANYEAVIKKISDSGGVVILDIFGTPPGLGKILDKRSPAWDLKAFKELIRGYIQELSVNKRYNVWYELWNAPDLDEFFIGKKQEYLNLYKATAEAIKELETQSKIYIPLGGPAVSWWFQNFDGNTIVTPEKSLIYELIKFCNQYKLPLDFISWHAYSTDPKVDKESTRYNKSPVSLVRDWLTYFNLDCNIPLIVDEWNYDSGANILPERQDKSYIACSYIPHRIKNMYEAGLDYQMFFALEDFHNEKEYVIRNTGIFWLKYDNDKYEIGPKSLYTVFKMLAKLGNEMFVSLPQIKDEFIDMIATREQESIVILITNYIDPDIFKNYLSRNIATLNEAERKSLINLFNDNALDKIVNKKTDIPKLRVTNKIKSVLKKAQELHELAQKFSSAPRNVRVDVKGLKGNYQYLRYAVDSLCNKNCEFKAVEERAVSTTDLYQETLSIKPYSVNMIIFNKKTPEQASIEGQLPAQNTNTTSNTTQGETK